MTGTELKLAFVNAAIMALLTIIAGAIFGKKVIWLLGLIGALSVILPLILIVLLGVVSMVNLEPGSAGVASTATISAVLDYVSANLPGLIISSIAGAAVGFLVTLFKKATPKKVRRKVARKIRLRA